MLVVTLRMLYRLFVVLALGLGLYDLVYQWVVNAQMKIRPLREIWGHEFLTMLMPAGLAEKALATPAPVVLAAIAGVVYLIYRALAFVSGKDKAVRLN